MNAFKKSALKALAVLLLGAVATGALGFGFGGSSLTKEQKAHVKEMKALHGVDDSWAKYYNGGKMDKVAALYADDAVYMPSGGPVVKGKAAIKAYFMNGAAAFKKSGNKFNITGTPDGDFSGDWGWVSGTYTVTNKAGGIVDAGKYLSVSHKIKGKWYYVRDSWNSDGAIPQVGASQ